MLPGRSAPRVLEGTGGLERPFVVEAPAAPDDRGAEAARALEGARERGYREGRERAEVELLNERESFRAAATAALARLSGLEHELLERHEARLLDVALEAASRILRHRLEQGDPVAARALGEAMQNLPTSGKLRARLHPDDVEGARTLLAAEVEAGRIEIVADPRITRGGTVVESPVGTIDATLEAGWDAIRNAAAGVENTP